MSWFRKQDPVNPIVRRLIVPLIQVALVAAGAKELDGETMDQVVGAISILLSAAIMVYGNWHPATKPEPEPVQLPPRAAGLRPYGKRVN